MKLIVNGYEIEIKAKKIAFDNRYNKEATQSFLNTISCWASAAADHDNMLGCYGMAKDASRAAKQIFDALDFQGYYDDVR